MTLHPISPVYDRDSKILILGSFPSVKSREEGFFYGHAQNRFWKVTSAVLGCKTPQTVCEKREFLLANSIAVWDVIGSCDIVGSADSTIKNVTPNDIAMILEIAEIKQIFVNGKTAYRYYNEYIKDRVGREAVCLPSTSPANAAWTFERLVQSWSIIKTVMEEDKCTNL